MQNTTRRLASVSSGSSSGGLTRKSVKNSSVMNNISINISGSSDPKKLAELVTLELRKQGIR
jgi:hypothetical protein